MSRLVAGLVLLGCLGPGAALAQTDEPPRPTDWTLEIGARLWATTGNSQFSHADADIAGRNPISDLHWRNMEAILPEVNLELVWKRFVLLGTVGGNVIAGGNFEDDDFADRNREGRYSHTVSTTKNGEIFYANTDVGFRIAQGFMRSSTQMGYVDALIGFQYWREHYEAWGIKGFLDTSFFVGGDGVVSRVRGNDIKIITHDFWYQSARLGIRYQVPIWGDWALKMKLIGLPYTKSRQEDIHWLRTDLKQDPSGRAKASGGVGMVLDGGITYNFWRGLSAELGLQYMKIDSNAGTETIFSVDEGPLRLRLHSITTERYGPYFGLLYKW
ncbi:MAG: hypothetical protein HY294_10380 [Candidatus Rokubacteria bacterium]|nr:hypothetical protein [Candidatus Rokubacteria bacterium]MBI3826390.1 hypothetical protein [Candidatus Rokubacteria bacterium]